MANPYFIAYAFHSHPEIVGQLTIHRKGAIMDGLNLTIIKGIKLKRPPIELQNKFEETFEKTEALKSQYLSSLRELEQLFGSLSQRAFKGELDLSRMEVSEEEQQTSKTLPSPTATKAEKTKKERPRVAVKEDTETSTWLSNRKKGKTGKVPFTPVEGNAVLRTEFAKQDKGFHFQAFEAFLKKEGFTYEYEQVKDFLFEKLEQRELLQYYANQQWMEEHYRPESSLEQDDFVGDGNIWLVTTKKGNTMKIRHFTINSPFRSLPSPFTLQFRQNNYYPDDNKEPICMVGLNGSGKSNSLELLSELFYYLELQTIVTDKALEVVNHRYAALDFELSYEISSYKWKSTLNKSRESLPFVESAIILVWCSKKAQETLRIEIKDKEDTTSFALPTYLWREILPNKVIGYSSGQNELISNPFIKLDYHYFDEFVKSTSERNYETNTEVNRMFFMDYESNELIVLANYLFDESVPLRNKGKADVNAKLAIEGLHSFSLRIQYRNYDGKSITFPSELNLGIEKLKQCATAWTDNELQVKNQRGRVLELSYYVDTAVKKAFRNVFKTAYELFRVLYLLRLMNIHSISPTARNRIKDAPQDANLSDWIPRPEMDKLVFKVQSICFRKKNVVKPVLYKQLSDGEHQLLHIMGTLKIMKENDVLFLLDEPETHFNPEWRAKMVRLMMETNQDEDLEQDHFITSHSPFIISDCKPTNVYLFHRKDGKLKVQTAHERRLNTFGTSVNILTEEVFNKNESQGEYAGIIINELMNRKYDTMDDITKAKEDARMLGDSVEKTLLFRKLLMLEDELTQKQ